MGNDSSEIIGVIVTLLVLGLLPVLARIYVRAVIKRNFGWDDWLIALSTVFGAIYAAAFLASVAFGFGRSPESLTEEQKSKITLWHSIGRSMIIIAFAPGKASVAVFLMRVFPQRSFKIVLWTIIVSSVIVFVTVGILNIVHCHPADKLWLPDKPGSCWRPETFAAVIYFAGFRTYHISAIGYNGDFDHNAVVLAIWALAEWTAINIAACVPSLRPLFFRGPHKHNASCSPGHYNPDGTPRYPATGDEGSHVGFAVGLRTFLGGGGGNAAGARNSGYAAGSRYSRRSNHATRGSGDHAFLKTISGWGKGSSGPSGSTTRSAAARERDHGYGYGEEEDVLGLKGMGMTHGVAGSWARVASQTSSIHSNSDETSHGGHAQAHGRPRGRTGSADDSASQSGDNSGVVRESSRRRRGGGRGGSGRGGGMAAAAGIGMMGMGTMGAGASPVSSRTPSEREEDEVDPEQMHVQVRRDIMVDEDRRPSECEIGVAVSDPNEKERRLGLEDV
ncbi:MAG: hypothetical protein M1831_006012 [Alyxoria varia]|nr:MAG: hypothetical protein M1831_006012 [Alyxoria varia]